MVDEEVDVVEAGAGGVERLAGDVDHQADRVAEDHRAVHADAQVVAAEADEVAPVRVGVQGDRADPGGGVRGREDDRARAVAEQHRRAAAVAVEVARERVGADDERRAGAARLDHRAAEGEAGEEAGARRAQVDRGGAVDAERARDERRGVGAHLVGAGRPDEDEVDVAGRDAGVAQRGLGGARGEVSQPLAVGQHVAVARAGAALDPGLLDAQAAGDRVVADDGLRDGVPAPASAAPMRAGVAPGRAGDACATSATTPRCRGRGPRSRAPRGRTSAPCPTRSAAGRTPRRGRRGPGPCIG